MHSFISILMYINIQTHITCIPISFIHDCIDHLVSYFNRISKVSSPGVSGPNVSPTFSISNGMFFIE
jgi:hypothetical protein